MLDVTSQRTDKPIAVDILDINGKKYKGKDAPVAHVFPAGSREYRIAFSKFQDAIAAVDKDAEDKIDQIFNAEIDLVCDLTESLHNLGFDGKDCADRDVMREMYAAVAGIRDQITSAARKPQDFLPAAPKG